MIYHIDDIVIRDAGPGAYVWTRVDRRTRRVESGFGWIDEDMLLLVRDGVAPCSPAAPRDRGARWRRTATYRFAEPAQPS